MAKVLTPQEVFNFYQDMLQNQCKLVSGYESILNQVNQYENFSTLSCKIILSTDVQHQTRLNVATLFRNSILDVWEKIPTKQKREIREILLHGIIINAGDLKIIHEIGLIIIDLQQKDGFEMWSQSLKQLITWMQQEELKIVETGLEFFCTIFSSDDNRMNLIVPQLMPQLFQLFTIQQLTNTHKEKILVLFYLSIRTFSYADTPQEAQLVKMCFDETYDIWMNLFISALQQDFEVNTTILNMLRYILKILTVIYRDFTYYSQKSLSEGLVPIWQFWNRFLNLYSKEDIYTIQVTNDKRDYYQYDIMYLYNEDIYETDNLIENLAIQSTELIQTLMTKDILYPVVKQAVFPLINSCCHYMILTFNQHKNWEAEYERYILDEYDGCNNSIRELCKRLIFDLIEQFKDQAIYSVIIVIQKFRLNQKKEETVEYMDKAYQDKSSLFYQSEEVNNQIEKPMLLEFIMNSAFDMNTPNETWLKNEVSLDLLGAFAMDILDHYQRYPTSFDLDKYILNIINDLNQESQSLIIAKSLWALSKYSTQLGKNEKDVFYKLFKVAIKSIQTKESYNVRMSALKALSICAQKLINQQNENIESLIDLNTFELIEDILIHSTEDVYYIIFETLIQLVTLSNKYTPMVSQIFSKYILSNFTFSHNHQIILKKLYKLIQLLVLNKESFKLIYAHFNVLIKEVFKAAIKIAAPGVELETQNQDFELIYSIFNITSVFLQQSDEETSQNIISLLEPLLNLMLEVENGDILSSASLCLKDFIKYVPELIIKHEMQQKVFQVIAKLLKIAPNSLNENSTLYAGNLIMMAFNNISKGNFDQQILKSVIAKLGRSRMPTIVQGLVLIYSRMINANVQQTIDFLLSFQLENKLPLKILIDKWLLQQPLFKGKATKNCTFQALINLFLRKDKKIENLIVLSYNPSHSNVGNDINCQFKIFSILIRALHNEMAFLRKEQDENVEIDTQQINHETQDDTIQEEQKDDNKIDVQMDVIKDEEPEEIRLETEKSGLGDQETGSTCYMTEGLIFVFDDGEDCDETTEEDLIYLQDACCNLNTSELLMNFFQDLYKTDPEYFQMCIKQLLKEDVQLLKQYIEFNL